MTQFRKKPVVIDAITFDELVAHGRAQVQEGALVNGMPWSFTYNGHAITHERDDCYLIPTLEGTHNFTPLDMLITGVKGEIYPCKLDIFAATYEPAGAAPTTFQDRVRAERAELDDRLDKLVAFRSTDTFAGLPVEEQERLDAQRAAMTDYSNTLHERIAAFA